jgi:cytochrome b subunit of formate dehydrogenase
MRREVRDAVERALRERARNAPKRPPIPAYQKVVFWLLVVFVFFALIRGVFFR